MLFNKRTKTINLKQLNEINTYSNTKNKSYLFSKLNILLSSKTGVSKVKADKKPASRLKYLKFEAPKILLLV